MLDALLKRVVKAALSDHLTNNQKDQLQKLADEYEARMRLSRGPDKARAMHHAELAGKLATEIERRLELVCPGKSKPRVSL